MKIRKSRYSLLSVVVVVTCVVLALVLSLLFFIAQTSTTNLEEYILGRRSAEVNTAGVMLNQDVESLYTHLYAELTDASLIRLRIYLQSQNYQTGYYDLVRMIHSRLGTFVKTHNLQPDLQLYMPWQRHLINYSSILRMSSADEEKLDVLCEQEYQNVALYGGNLYLIFKKYETDTENQIIGVAGIKRSALESYLNKLSVSDSGDVALFVETKEGVTCAMALGDGIDNGAQAQIAAMIGNTQSGDAQLIVNSVRSLVAWVRVGSTPMLLCHIIPMDSIDAQLSEFRMSIVSVLAAVVVLLIALIVFLYTLMLTPQKVLRSAYQKVENGELSVRLNASAFEEYDKMYAGFNHMIGRLQDLIEREYEMNLLSVKAEIQEMRYQINPHFLYNSYFNLRAMLIDEDYDQAEKLADLLGHYLHYITASGQGDASLREELEHAEYYMQIQQMRFGRRVQTQMQPWPQEELSRAVPRMILQPLLENAYSHGMRDVDSGGVIAVRFESAPDRLSIIVEDNGSGADDAQLEDIRQKIASRAELNGTEGLALRNIHRRLALRYGPESGLYVSRSPLGGFCAEIRIMEGEEHVPDADRG